LTPVAKLRLGTFVHYLGALALCLFVVVSVLNVRPEARTRPYAYQGDTMFYHLVSKSVTKGGWFLDVPELGAPGSLNLRDVPTSDNNLHVLTLWLLARGTSNYAEVLNHFLLLTFPMVFLLALMVMRHFGVGWTAGVCASLLYAFAPFHFTRGEHHLFLSAYWPVPLAVMLMLWVSRQGFGSEQPVAGEWRRSRLAVGVLISLILAGTGYYYAFFTCFFLLIAAAVRALRYREWRCAWPGIALIVVISAGVTINLWPSLAHFRASGASETAQRDAGDADQYALRIAQMLLPVSGHRLSALEGLKAEYNRRPLINENDHAAIGVTGAVGFLGLLWWFFFRKPSADALGEPGARGLLHHLSIFSFAGVLLGTIGGFGSLVAFFGLTQVRAYSRISVFLAFFALFAVALWVDEALRRHATSPRRRIAAHAVLALVMLVALGDQISPRMLPDYQGIARQFDSDAAFVHAIEARVPRAALIFQLPYIPFPESTPVSRMNDYDLLRGYLHSDHLRWSYGTVRGREENAWLRQLAALPTEELLDALVWAGFHGIYIDRHGFDDDGQEIERQLSLRLQERPLDSADHRLAFYALTNHRERVARDTPRAEWESRREAALHPPLVVWRNGFYDPEGTSEHGWRWARSRGRMELVNRSKRAQQVRLDMTLVGNDGGHVMIDTPLLSKRVTVGVTRRGERVGTILVLPPGRYPVDFSSDAQPLYPPDDFRDLVFSVQNFALTAIEAGAPQRAAAALSGHGGER
jgi:phosphoglycerol transferase